MYTHFTVVCIKVYMNNDTNYCNKSAVHIYGGTNAPNSDVQIHKCAKLLMNKNTNAPNYWCTVYNYTNAPNYWCTITQMHQIKYVQLHKCTKLVNYLFTNTQMHQITDVQIHKCTKLLYLYTNTQMHQITYVQLHKCIKLLMYKYTNAPNYWCTNVQMQNCIVYQTPQARLGQAGPWAEWQNMNFLIYYP